MVAYSHLSMIAFVILGLSMVRLMINYSSLLAKNHNDDPDDDVVFYWPHTAFSFPYVVKSENIVIIMLPIIPKRNVP